MLSLQRGPHYVPNSEPKPIVALLLDQDLYAIYHMYYTNAQKLSDGHNVVTNLAHISCCS